MGNAIAEAYLPGSFHSQVFSQPGLQLDSSSVNLSVTMANMTEAMSHLPSAGPHSISLN